MDENINVQAFSCLVASSGRLQMKEKDLGDKEKDNGINAKMRFFSANERSKGEGKGKEKVGKGRGGKGERERENGSEALAETEKIANAPAGNRTRNPSKRG